ncbi:MATE family efflux transporter [Parafannyhessea umbonata]|uniref:Putative efflux protein, MATE family n=1 Tax=Parafannyhessea umbonata TaxID=604330 RepID=A0A1G6MMP0_9ACTN|nr:MATE family efflux transporter [Parafannyhessea umbonata]SDC56497.1 putative efflux protein, MATE family [Parafannyhessea umbonata]
MARQHNEIQFLSGNMWTNVLRFAIPVALTSILEQLSSLIDTVMIGRLMGPEGTVGMAAVGANTQLTSLIIVLFVGISLGTNVTVASALGAGDHEAASRAAHTSILMALVGLAVIALGELVAQPVLVLLQVPPETLPDAVLFLRVFLLGMPSVLLYNFEAAILRADGDARFPMQALCLSAVLNVVLDLLFIGVFGWGVVGSAIATDLCYTTIAVLLFVRLLHLDSPVRIDPHRLRVDRKSLRAVVQIGLPAGIQSAVFSIANIVIQGAINSLGTEVMAASSAGMNIEFVCYSLLNSFSQACTTFVGQNRGARNLDRCKRVLAVCAAEGAVAAALLILFAVFLGRQVLGLINPDPAVVKYGYMRLCTIFPAYAFSMFYEVISGYLRGFGMSTPPALTTMIVICGLRFFWIAVVFPASHTFQTIMNIYPISLGLNCVCLIALLLILHPVRTLTKKGTRAA